MSSLKIFNTLAREKQRFIPIEPGKVRMYVCGMTVYDFCHIGHARVMLVFDLVQRWLRASGFDVTYVRNVTDIDDKIIKRAAASGKTTSELTSRFIMAMDEDAAALGIQKPDHEPRATDYIPQMLGLIEALEKNGLAYQASDGDVNYSVRDFAGYGKLSGKSVNDLRAGERVDINAGKRDPLDFVLWKAAKDNEPEEVKWQSPWGCGRPGWHLECSAMASHFAEQFDIHGGGADLQFPHHENEIAQSEGASQHSFVNYWMHNGFVRVDNEKMSKSLGNFFTIRDVLKQYDAETVRFFILRAHYRSQLNYSDAHLIDARNALTRLYIALKDVTADTEPLDMEEVHARRFSDAMNDDFNTPLAFAILFELAGEVNRTKSSAMARQLSRLAGIVGLLQRPPQDFLRGSLVRPGDADELETFVTTRIAARLAAKKDKNFAAADRIRAELVEKGILLEDKPGGTTEWRRV